MTRRWIAAAGLLAAACGSTPTPTQPPPFSAAPQISCPADVNVKGITGGSQPVTYTAPTVTAGTAPVNMSCSQVSGASFPVGTSTVSCTATDAQSRQSACSFKVTVSALALVAVKNFETFGDSLTQGETGRPNIVPDFIDTPNAYPTRLQAALDVTYPGQGITVLNHGVGGETIEQTLARVISDVPVDKPGAVLLLGGFNNLTSPCGPGLAGTAPCADAIAHVADGVRDCIRRVKEANVGVKYTFVSTLTPPGATGSNRIDGNAIVQANVRIKQTVATEGVILVDSYASFLGHESEYVNVDGLHLRPAGYQALADGFLAAIRAAIPPTPLASLSGAR